MFNNIYNRFKVEILLSLLSISTFYLWYNTSIYWVYAVVFYVLLFGVLLYTKQPLSYLIVVTIFSIVARNKELTPNYDYFLTVILFCIIVIKLIIKRELTIGKLFFLLVVNLIYSFISLTYTPDLKYGLYGIGGLFQGYMGYLIVTNSDIKFNKDTLINISKIASFFLLVVTIEILNKYAHFDITKITQLKHAVRLGWQYSNLIAPFYIFFIPVALYKHTVKNKFYPIYGLIDLLNIVGLVLTLSRGGYVGLAIALIIFILFNIKNYLLFIKLGSVGIISALSIYLIPWTNKLIGNLISNLKQGDFFDDNSRYDLWNKALELFKEKPLFGWGENASNHLIALMNRTNHFFHNFVLQVAVCFGIIGLVILLVILIKSFFILFKPKDKFLIAIGAAIAGSLVHQFVDVMFDYLMFGLVFYTLIGLAEVYRHHNVNDDFKLNIRKQNGTS